MRSKDIRMTTQISLLNELKTIVKQAGAVALEYFGKSNEVEIKPDGSKVSAADYAVNDFLQTQLTALDPSIGWLSEESPMPGDRLNTSRLWIVDPIDGTRGFLDGNPRWCISIAVVEGTRPVEAVLFCPALGQMFAAKSGSGLITENVEFTSCETSGRPRVTGSKKLIETLKSLPDRPFDVDEFVPSLAYRLAMVAAGMLDGAFAWPGASEWDIAAADLLLQESGCVLSTRAGKPILYNQKNVRVPALVAARKDKQTEILALAESSGILH